MTFRTRMLSLLAATGIVVLAACGGSDSPVAPSAGATLKLTNGASVPLISVNFTQCTDETWGPSRLNPNESIPPGGTRTWSLGTGCWDVRVSTGSKSGYWYDLQATAGQTIDLTASSGLNP